MDAAIQTLDFVASIFIFLAFIPALWISGRIILRNSMSEDHSTRLFLWLALAGFFIIPLVDLISYLRGLFMLVIPSDQNTGEVQLFMGTTSLLFYSILFTAIGVITYSAGIYYGRKIMAEQRLPVIKDLALSSFEQNFVALGLAGLFSRMIRGIILNFISISIPTPSGLFFRGFMGSFIGWVLAFIILAIVLIYMDGKLRSQQE